MPFILLTILTLDSMCNKYFSDEACTNEITELQTHVVKYLDGNGTLTTLNEIATAVTSSSTSWNDGWYVVYDDVTIADRITNELHRGVTSLDGKGWYTKDDATVLVVVARKHELKFLLNLIKEEDPQAFLSVGSVTGVYGTGFDVIKK